MGLVSHAFDLGACLTLTVDMTHMYPVVDRDNSGVPPDGERSGRYKESPPKKEMIILTICPRQRSSTTMCSLQTSRFVHLYDKNCS